MSVKTRLLTGFALFISIFATLMLIYRGLPVSGDEIFIYDSVESFVNRGDFTRTYEYNLVGEPGQHLAPGSDGAPWLRPLHEPLTYLSIAPLFWVGQQLPDTGTMHVVWLFNLFVTASTALSLYFIALRWHYSIRVAICIGVIYAVATNTLFYSRLLFREPLMALFILWAFFFAVEVRQQRQKTVWIALLLCAMAFVSAFLVKAMAVFVLPILLFAILPSQSFLVTHRKPVIGLVGVVIVGMVALIALLQTDALGTRYSLDTIANIVDRTDIRFIGESILGYQFSFGRSFWLYSPILLLGLIGAVLWVREGRWRLVAGLPVTMLLFSVWYGMTLSFDWLGGWGWGPRYLVPLIPLFTLWLLPVLVRANSWRRAIGIGGIVLLSTGIQFLGIAVPLSNYYTDLNTNGKIYNFDLARTDPDYLRAEWGWMDAIWTWEWSPLRYHLQRLDLSNLDIAWYDANPSWIAPLLALVTALVAMSFIVWLQRYQKINIGVYVTTIIVLFGLLGMTIMGGFLTLRQDVRYVSDWGDVYTLVQQLNQQVERDDVVFVDRHLYTPIFMNYFKSPALMATLPYAPGEVFNETGPQVISDVLSEQVGYINHYALDWTAARYDRLWLVASTSPFDTTKVRPIERYLVENHFPVREIETSPRARAILFYTGADPTDAPTEETNARFGESIRLNGYTMSGDRTYAPGAMLPLTLFWEVDSPPAMDYNIGIFVLDNAGNTVAQRDSQPQATFGYMTRWTPGNVYPDNHALHLDLSEGAYEVVLAVYDWRDGSRLSVEGGGDTLPLGTINIER